MYSESMEFKHVYMVGIKGTGMAALAELLKGKGVSVTGSDVPQKFFTDELLKKAGILYFTDFKKENISKDVEMVIHSSAYNVSDNPELIEATKRGLPIYKYTEALGYLSSLSFSVGISGIHGKTTTTAITGTIVKCLGLNASTLVGSGVPSFNGSAINFNGSDIFVAETCEYQRHFLSFHPNIIVITSLEMDHPDYFKDYEDIVDAFISYIKLLPINSDVIYCLDDSGVMDLYNRVKKIRPDLNAITYGQTVNSYFGISQIKTEVGVTKFKINGIDTVFELLVPGVHTVLDTVAGIAVSYSLLKREGINPETKLDLIKKGLLEFKGTKRRSEILGNKKGVLFIDDYGHHPTAIDTTLRGYRDFYPDRRIIIDFMSHTYSRTEKLLKEFASSFSAADIVILNKIYASARENNKEGVTGESLYLETLKYHKNVYYCPEYEDAVAKALEILQDGDLFVTMGAGNNWQVGEKLLEEF
ncbi:MAG: UDP-N-acetylmuramate--L-alanine ligase [Spirochaetales bacterium]|nr:UDP-N-acetylmuramate--L-alanine ligase [Spirochaetales bacterium]